MRLAVIIASLLIAITQAAGAAEVWRCSLRPQGATQAVEISFEVRGNTLLRSPDDYSGQRLAYGITKNSPATLTASKGTQTVVLRKLDGAGIMTGGAGPGWRDVWKGPCLKI
jgi:hypothetical protein